MRNGISRRPAVAIVMTLTVIAVVALLLSVIAVQVFSQRMAGLQRHHQLQAQWLARAGVEQAAARLLKDPAPFTEKTSDLRIMVEKMDDGTFQVTAEAEVGLEDGPIVVRSATARFRRTEVDGVIRLQAK